jgi:IS605 OrfB family transposase
MATRTVEQKESLDKTIDLYTKAWNYYVDVAWEIERVSKIGVHKKAYYNLKEAYGLKAQYLCSSRDRAVEAVKAARALRKVGKKISKPSTELIPIRLDRNSLSFDKERTKASVATQDGRIKIPLVWHRQAKKFVDWFCNSGEIGIDRNGRWVLRLIFTKEPVMPQRTNNVFGADRGIKHPIVLSNNKFYGESWWKEHERKILLLIARLQSQGTKSAKHQLKKVWLRLRRFREDCDRVIAKRIIVSLLPGDTIVLEILTNIRDRCGAKGKVHKKHRAKMGRWSFKRLENAITYNAELRGIYVERVKTHYTSQTCSMCGEINKSNRRSQSLYSCSCGLTLNADLNAARNIAYKWCIANGGTSGLSVNQPIVAGVLSSASSYKPPISIGGS